MGVLYRQKWVGNVSASEGFMSGTAAPGFYSKSPNYGTDPEDPNYKEVVEAENVKTATVNGRRVLDADTYPGYDEGDDRYQNSGCLIQGMARMNGLIEGAVDHLYVKEGYAFMDCFLSASAFDEGGGENFYNVFALCQGNTSHDIELGVEYDAEEAELYASYIDWNLGSTTVTVPFTRADWVNKRVRFRIEWKSCHDDDFNYVEPGYFRFKVTDLDTMVTTTFHDAAADPYIGGSLFAVAHIANTINTCFAPGFAGMFGPCEWFEIGGGEAGQASQFTALPEPVVVSSVPNECCGPETLNHHTQAGPILPVVDPEWDRECTGGGTVPSAPDILEPESWVS